MRSWLTRLCISGNARNVLTALTIAGSVTTSAAFAQNNSLGEALAKKNDCLGCHAAGVKLVGPAYKDVAAKYAGNPDAASILAVNIRNGGVGKWGDLPMPAQTKLSDTDIKQLSDWILSLK